MKYPYTPKSNKHLKKGDYWIIELKDGNYAIGVVVDLPPSELKLRVLFIAGLLDWKSRNKPRAVNFKNSKVIKYGKAHVKTIAYTGKEIIGNINLESNNIDSMSQNKSAYLKEHNINNFSSLNTWGYNYIKVLADKLT